LASAAAALEETDWGSFSIRDVAARAGVSGGAVYRWFSGKGEIWAHLQTARIPTP
jgi:AcrR family transcriptional regulator